MFTFYFFCAVGNGGIRCFFLAVLRWMKTLRRNPSSDAFSSYLWLVVIWQRRLGVFFSGCKQILKDLVWRSQMPAFHTWNILEQECMFDDFSHIRILTVPLYIRELCFKLMNFCFVSKSASVGHF